VRTAGDVLCVFSALSFIIRPRSSSFLCPCHLACLTSTWHHTVIAVSNGPTCVGVGPRRNPLALRRRGRIGERDVALAVR
jgi:hypothetical protein